MTADPTGGGAKADILVAEIGSTVTKVNAFALASKPKLLAHGESATTVSAGDVTLGLQAALADLEAHLGKKGHGQPESYHDVPMCASSSAAGGLRMTVHGLVRDMTVRAAREAALGAGAVLHLVTAGKLTPDNLNSVKEINPNIILITGGVENGERKTAVYNARKLAGLGLHAPVVYAGNSVTGPEVARAFDGISQRIRVVENVYPRLDELNIEPTRRVIQEVFNEHITIAPGMQDISQMVVGKIMPTPGAVMEAAKLLADDIGDLIVIDMGGATTDVHSVTSGAEEVSKILLAPEPEAKRTVEGDLGLFVSASNVVDMIGKETLASELGFAIDDLPKNAIPGSPHESKFTRRLAQEIISVAISRHVGIIKHLYGPTGRITVAEGKDLSQVKWIIGTGGFFTHHPKVEAILRTIRAKERGIDLLPPASAKILIDRDYIMSSAGVLAEKSPIEALTILKQSLGLQD